MRDLQTIREQEAANLAAHSRKTPKDIPQAEIETWAGWCRYRYRLGRISPEVLEIVSIALALELSTGGRTGREAEYPVLHGRLYKACEALRRTAPLSALLEG